MTNFISLDEARKRRTSKPKRRSIMRNITFVVTTSTKNTNIRRNIMKDFIFNNRVVYDAVRQVATNSITGDEYRFYNIMCLEDAYKIYGLTVHPHIHLEPLPCLGKADGGMKNEELGFILQSRLRR